MSLSPLFTNSNALPLSSFSVAVLPIEETAKFIADKIRISRNLISTDIDTGRQHWLITLRYKHDTYEITDWKQHKTSDKPTKYDVVENLLSTAQIVNGMLNLEKDKDLLVEFERILYSPDLRENYDPKEILELYKEFNDNYECGINQFIATLKKAFSFLTFINNNFRSVFSTEEQPQQEQEDPKITYKNSLNTLIDYVDNEEFKHFNETVWDYFNQHVPPEYLCDNMFDYEDNDKLDHLFKNHPELKKHVYYNVWFIKNHPIN